MYSGFSVVNVARNVVGDVGFLHSRWSDGGSDFVVALLLPVPTILDILNLVDAAAALVIGEGGGYFPNLTGTLAFPGIGSPWLRAVLLHFPRFETLEDVDDDGNHEEHAQDDGERVRGHASSGRRAAPDVHLVPHDVILAAGEIGVVDAFRGVVEEPERRDPRRVLQSDDARVRLAYYRALSATSYVHERVMIHQIVPLTVRLEVLLEGEVEMVLMAEEIAMVHLLKMTQRYPSHPSD